MHIFIDESGDSGFKTAAGSSAVFVAALVAFNNGDLARAADDAIEAYAARANVRGEFKFNKTRPEIKDGFFAAVAHCDFCVRAIVVEKDLIYSERLRTKKESFYSFFLKSMLKFDNGLLQDARVKIDGSGDRAFKQELEVYLKRHCQERAIREIKFVNSKSDRLIQLADMCVGAIARSYRTDRMDADRWRKMIAPKIDNIWQFR